jgi:hypothetical protein
LVFVSPIFIEKQGRDMARAAIVLPPLHHASNTWKDFWASGCPWSTSFLCFLEEESRWKQGEEKSSSSPASRV